MTTGRRSDYSIGELSRITGLSVKTLRFYHEEGVLVPSRIDPETGYRYYGARHVDAARVITQLRELEFSLNEIKQILSSCEDEADLLDQLERQKEAIQEKVGKYRAVASALDGIITREKEARKAMAEMTFDVQEKSVPSILVAGIRMKGKYSDCGQGFAKLGRALGFRIRGKPMMLIHDTEYREGDADFEPCMPISKAKSGDERDGISVREIPGGKVVSLVHLGPYEQLGRSYAKAFDHVKQKGYTVLSPTREVYLKGPGMIFKGNSKKYLTEIQLPVKE